MPSGELYHAHELCTLITVPSHQSPLKRDLCITVIPRLQPAPRSNQDTHPSRGAGVIRSTPEQGRRCVSRAERRGESPPLAERESITRVAPLVLRLSKCERGDGPRLSNRSPPSSPPTPYTVIPAPLTRHSHGGGSKIRHWQVQHAIPTKDSPPASPLTCPLQATPCGAYCCRPEGYVW